MNFHPRSAAFGAVFSIAALAYCNSDSGPSGEGSSVLDVVSDTYAFDLGTLVDVATDNSDTEGEVDLGADDAVGERDVDPDGRSVACACDDESLQELRLRVESIEAALASTTIEGNRTLNGQLTLTATRNPREGGQLVLAGTSDYPVGYYFDQNQDRLRIVRLNANGSETQILSYDPTTFVWNFSGEVSARLR